MHKCAIHFLIPTNTFVQWIRHQDSGLINLWPTGVQMDAAITGFLIGRTSEILLRRLAESAVSSDWCPARRDNRLERKCLGSDLASGLERK